MRFASFQRPSTPIQATSNRDHGVYFRLGESFSAYYLLGGRARSHGKFRAFEITGKVFISNNREKLLSNFFRHPVSSLHKNKHLTKKIVQALYKGYRWGYRWGYIQTNPIASRSLFKRNQSKEASRVYVNSTQAVRLFIGLVQ